mmetsp:Transcript_16354/g.24096  ORF Transcript_16354/g.24096 Transcript_16354/m.24096 type:complete len:110 (-) Transcript_16354:1503-1832(-)
MVSRIDWSISKLIPIDLLQPPNYSKVYDLKGVKQIFKYRLLQNKQIDLLQIVRHHSVLDFRLTRIHYLQSYNSFLLALEETPFFTVRSFTFIINSVHYTKLSVLDTLNP